MTRSDSLPAEVVDWLHRIPREEIRSRLASSIVERASHAGLRLEAGTLVEDIDAIDARYFAAHEDGQEEEALREFKRARLLSAQRFLLDGEEEEAFFEFFHSLDDATPTGLLAALKMG